MEELRKTLPVPDASNGHQAASSDLTAGSAISHADLYKSKPAATDPETRRRDFILHQREKRWDIMALLRNLTDEEEELEEETVPDGSQEAAGEEEEEEARQQEPRKRGWVARRNKAEGKKSFYSDHLMLSEWMVEVPEDLEEQWYIKLCPEGQRRLVVARRGTTKVFTKDGKGDSRFPWPGFRSYLPGGNRTMCYQGHTLLDCLYVGKERTFYILDLIAWNTQIFYNCETEFRFYWLDHRAAETTEMSVISGNANPYRFIPLPSFPSTLSNLEKAMTSSKFKVDGVLFFHKQAHYTLGTTPLVLWLKPFMLPEVFGLPVQELYRATRPVGYTDYRSYIASGQWARPRTRARKKRCKGDNSMEVTESDSGSSLPSPACTTSRDASFCPVLLSCADDSGPPLVTPQLVPDSSDPHVVPGSSDPQLCSPGFHPRLPPNFSFGVSGACDGANPYS